MPPPITITGCSATPILSSVRTGTDRTGRAMSTPLSIVIVSWNTRELTLTALRSFLPAAAGQELEVVVVDNASADGSADAIAAAFPEIHLIRNERNVGFAGGVNVGLAAA